MLFKPGEKTKGSLSCEIIRLLAKSRKAEVYITKLCGTEHKLILKVTGKDNLERKNLKEEAMLLNALRLRGIPELYEWAEEKERAYYIMSYHEGITLQQYKEKTIAIPEWQVKEVGQKICRILMYLHDRAVPVIHSDIKPSNILINEKDIVLLDFGVAQLLQGVYKDNFFRGTPGFAAPECWEKQGEISTATDIFALGVTLYYLLEDKERMQCFGRYELHEENSYKKNRWQPVLNRCTAPDPHERYQSAVQLYHDLEKIKN